MAKFKLNSDYRLEPILLSLTDENYSTVITQIKMGLENYDRELVIIFFCA